MKYQSLFLSVVFICILGSLTFSQNTDNPRTQRKHGLSLKAGGDYTVLGLVYDVFITPQINTEINASLYFPGIGASVHYHPWGNKDNWR